MNRLHIVGSGVAGLATGVFCSSRFKPILYESAQHAGGRCRTYHDTRLGISVDNGNHLFLSGNTTIQAYLRKIKAPVSTCYQPQEAHYRFYDIEKRRSWDVRPNRGMVPWWIFSRERRVPDSTWWDYVRASTGLLRESAATSLAGCFDRSSVLYKNFFHPVCLAIMNTPLEECDPSLARRVFLESVFRGGASYRPMYAQEGLSTLFVTPALQFLAEKGGEIRYGHRLRHVEIKDQRVTALYFNEGVIAIGKEDAVVLALPGFALKGVLPWMNPPEDYRAILNVHFLVRVGAHLPRITGVLNSVSEWIFVYPDYVSVTISAAERYGSVDRETLISRIWEEVRVALSIEQEERPLWQIVKERRATVAATRDVTSKRLNTRTPITNLMLAGDWTATGLPSTLEGALRSGKKAAEYSN